MAETIVEKHMRLLGCTKEEAEQLIQDDYEIDHMKISDLDNDLTEEQKKARKMYKNDGERKKTAPKREKNATKTAIINEIFALLNENEEISCENLAILNSDRLISFSVGDDNFEIVLQKKNKNKK